MELGLGEIVLILLVSLLVYGGRLPQVAAAVGPCFLGAGAGAPRHM